MSTYENEKARIARSLRLGEYCVFCDSAARVVHAVGFESAQAAVEQWAEEFDVVDGLVFTVLERFEKAIEFEVVRETSHTATIIDRD